LDGNLLQYLPTPGTDSVIPMKPPPIVLSEAQMKQGVEACFRNAERLKTSAVRMLKEGEGGFALAFAAIRIEELGKVKLLRDRSAASETDAES